MARIVVIGGKESGVGAALLAKKLGHEVLISDAYTLVDPYRTEITNAGLVFEESGHSSDLADRFDIMVLSPGVPFESEVVSKFKAEGKEVISEIEFAWRQIGESQVVGITGSNGKTTLTTLIWHILNHSQWDVRLVGNVGYSFARTVAENPGSAYICELSSFQLETIDTLKPTVSIVTNITPDHLDRYHNDMALYAEAKFRIALNQDATDLLILNGDDPATNEYFKSSSTAATVIRFSYDRFTEGKYFSASGKAYDLTEMPLKGRHNVANMAMAIETCERLGLGQSVIEKGLNTFENLAHRMEYVATVKGVEFINDSKATNVDSVWYALDAMTKPVVWIAGGTDKGNDYSAIVPLVQKKVKYMICMGVNNAPLIEAFADHVQGYKEVKSASEAVQMALNHATEGDVVLLSPACASFDLFKNYMDRGDQYKMAIRNLL